MKGEILNMKLTEADRYKLFEQCTGYTGEGGKLRLDLGGMFQNPDCFEKQLGLKILKKDLSKINTVTMCICWSYICAGIKTDAMTFLKDIDEDIYMACRLVMDYDSTVENFSKQRVNQFIRKAMNVLDTELR